MPRSFLLLLLVLVALIGCGGGGGRSPARTTPVRFGVAWPARSRETAAPSSALSATLTLTGTGGGLVQTFDRSAALGSYLGTYATDVAVKPGAYAATLRFYAAAGGTGTMVAQGSANVVIARDGAGIGTVGLTNTVQSVAVVAGQTVPRGATVQLAFEARDAGGALVAVSPGSAVWSLATPTSGLTVAADGLATGAVAGTASVRVTLDGIASPAATVTVEPDPVASVVVDPNQSVPFGGTRQLTFTAKDANGNVLPLAPASAAWTVVSGDSLTLGGTGLATAVHAGTAQVQVTVGGVTSPAATVAVSTAPVASVVVNPGQTVPYGGTLQLAFTAKDAQGNVLTVPAASATWSRVGAGTNFSLSASGLASGLHAGNGSVKVVVDGVTSPAATVTVAPAPLASLTVDPGQFVPGGTTRQLTYVARNADGDEITLAAGAATWTLVSGGANLSLTSGGLATGLQTGTATVRVSASGVVSPDATVAVAVAPVFDDAGFEAASVPTNEWREDVDVVGSSWTGDPHWGVADGSGAWGTGGHSGQQYAFLQASTVETSQGSVRQTASGLVVGRSYRLVFWAARRNGNVGGNVAAPVVATVDGALILTPTTPPGAGAWSKITSSAFTATAPSMTFMILSQPPSGIQDTTTLVDDVSLEFAP